MSAITKTPELCLEPDESQQLAEAAQKVQELYDMPIMDEKTLAWINLGIVAGRVYGSRVIAITVRKKGERRPPKPKLVEVDWNVQQ